MKFFDKILDICHLEYAEAVKKEIENGGIDCTDGVGGVSRDFDRLREEIEQFAENIGVEFGKQHSVLRKMGQFIVIANSRYSTSKTIEKILCLTDETVLKEWPEQR